MRRLWAYLVAAIAALGVVLGMVFLGRRRANSRIGSGNLVARPSALGEARAELRERVQDADLRARAEQLRANDLALRHRARLDRALAEPDRHKRMAAIEQQLREAGW